jgi:hypothetical protein
MSSPAHFNGYPNLAFARDSHGVLVLRVHSDGGDLLSCMSGVGGLTLATLAVVGLHSSLLAG